MATLIATNNQTAWETLREEGLKYLQDISGHIWTDYNIHDPGITLLELLCYAIVDLENRLSFNIEDILADNSNQKQFFSPAEILTVNPVTINDYRKLLLDIHVYRKELGEMVPCIKNVWIEPETDTDPDLYYDKDNNALLYDFSTGAQRIRINGLFRVYIEKDEHVNNDVADNDVIVDNYTLSLMVKEKLHAHRNICEDFEEIHIMEQDTISVFTDIQIDDNPDVDVNEVMARIYYDLENFISPSIKHHSLKRMLKKGKSIEEIFTGTQLEYGFIDDDELDSSEKRRELYTSDLIRIIMSHKEVRDVRNLFISNKPNPDILDKKEWALALDDTKALLLEEFNSAKIRLFKGKTVCPVSTTQVLSIIKNLKEQSKREIFDDPAMDIEETLGEYSDLTEYTSIEYKLPVNYGISETGLPSTATNKRRAQAKQLRAYLLFFEQLLVNYFKQLDSFKNIFSLKQDKENILKTYFSQLLPESLWETDYPEIEEVYEYREDNPNDTTMSEGNAFNRKSRILNHLLAQFNEKFADYALFGYKYNTLINFSSDEKKSCFLIAKADFLESYPLLSKNRNRGYNYFSETGEQNINGLRNFLASKLGLDSHISDPANKKEFDNFHIVEHILLRPSGNLPLDFINSEKIAEEYQPDPYSYRLSFVMSKKVERFGNSKFRELVYNSIETETPAHISYNILEFDSEQMNSFKEIYNNYLTEMKEIKSNDLDQYNSYRNKLIEILGIGRVKLPVLHLDANKVDGIGGQDNESPVSIWKDLSRNNNDAEKILNLPQPKYIKNSSKGHPSVRFDQGAYLKINKSLITDDFSIAVVYKASVIPGNEDNIYKIITGSDSSRPNFSLSYKGDGDFIAGLNNESITLESTVEIPHIALFTRDKETGELKLFIDGVVKGFEQINDSDISLIQESIIIGSGEQGTACDISEIIILDSAITGSRKIKLEEYLSEKWGIPLSAISSIEKPSLHLDASNSRSVIRDDNKKRIMQWNDLSQTGITVKQDTASLRPEYVADGINGLAAVRFNNTMLSIPNSGENKFFAGDFTIAVVYRAIGQGPLIDGTITGNNNERNGFDISIGQKGDVDVRSKNENIKLSAFFNDAHMAIITGEKKLDELDITINLDGKTYTSGKFSDPQAFSSGPDNLTIGQSLDLKYNFLGDIAEIVIYDTVLSIWDRQRLEQHLSEKWKIDTSGVNQLIMPVMHLDASKLASIQYDEIINNDNTITKKIYNWNDLSLYKNSAVQTNNFRKPEFIENGINGLGTVLFTQKKISDTDYYEDSLNIQQIIQSDFTIIIAFKSDSDFYLGGESDLVFDVTTKTQWTEGAALLDADCSGFYNDFGVSIGKSNGKMIIMGGIGDRVNRDHTIKSRELEFNKTHVITFTRLKDTGEVKLYADGLLHAEADLRDNVILNDSKIIKIGAFNSEGKPFHGSIGEIIIFNTVLTDAKRKTIERYISAKWNIDLASIPIDNANLVAHLDASDAESITKDANNRISEWHDANDISTISASQLIVDNQPMYGIENINGKPGLRFNNSFMDMNLEVISYDNITIAIVFNAISSGICAKDWNYGAGLIDNYTEANPNSFGISINKNNELVARLGTYSISASCTLNCPHIALVSRNISGEIKIYLDGILVSSGNDSGTALSIPRITIGAIQTANRGYFHGDISEIALFNKMLEIEEKQSLEKYLSMKWKIDITGINNIVKPVLHLDASKITSVIKDTDNRISAWLDLNSHDYNAIQTDLNKQPLYKQNAYNSLSAVNFNKSSLTIPRIVQNDFTAIVVYKTDPDIDISEYMPVSKDAFTELTGFGMSLSEIIWTKVQEKGFIDDEGYVLPAFTPEEPGFTLGLNMYFYENVKDIIESELIAIISESRDNNRPVTTDAFVGIAGYDNLLSEAIWTQVRGNDFIDEYGNVLSAFTPNKDDFSLNLEMNIFNNAKKIIEFEVIAFMAHNRENIRPVLPNTFTDISGVDETISLEIWNRLKEKYNDKEMGFIDTDGFTTELFDNEKENIKNILDIDNIIESSIINVMLAQNWFEGVGLIDGNCAGDRNDIYKRDFGILIGKNQKLIAGIGVRGEQDYKIEVDASFNRLHIGIFIRKKDTGVVKLYVDQTASEYLRVARNITLKDSNRFTIGAVNTGGNYFKGDIAEIMILDKVLEENEIKYIQNYLARKWGIDLL